ncbi:MAG: flagellar basal body-associated FliL family protein [Gemmatimonadetes bacterium]|nr:flagellar basal body-associated FliL family protein [Gemmatimonadota bacterium]
MPDEQTPAEAEAPAAPAAAPARGKLPVIVGLVVVGIAAGGAVGALGAGPVLAKKFTAPPAAEADSAAAEGEAKPEGEAKAEAKGEVNSYLIDNLVLNPANSGGGRFLLASLNLRLKDAVTKDALAQRDAEARDAILRILGTKQVEELVDIGNREKFKREIRAVIEGMFAGRNVVVGVYFSQFVIQ